MQITRTDVLWNYAATFLRIASSALLLPFILRIMPAETVGIWTVFMTITAFSNLLDFGFNPSFARNVTYIFSGVRTLKSTGLEKLVYPENNIVDYGLLKGLISAMKWFYLRMAIILFLLLITIGTWYISSLLEKYNGNTNEVYIAWFLLCAINTYSIYTLYYDSLLLGKGLIKKSKQIIIVGNLVYLAIAAILILRGYGLIAIIAAQSSSVLIIRFLSYRSFFNPELKAHLKNAIARPKRELFKALTPNAVKSGLTSFGGFLVQRLALLIGSFYLTLEEIASYGITMQLINIIAVLAGIFTTTFLPKIVQLRVENNIAAIKKLYIKGQIIMIFTFITGGMILLILGEGVLEIIGSQTKILPFSIMLLFLFTSLVEMNLSMAGSILLTKNTVPFYKASLISGSCIVFGLMLGFHYTSLNLLILVLVPLSVDLLYQGWKWPWEVIKELSISIKDYYNAINSFSNLIKI
jgi:O-antigen/teichoic acid export membrane protein